MGAGDTCKTLPNKEDMILNKNRVLYGNVERGKGMFKSKSDFRLKFGYTLHHQALMAKKRFIQDGHYFNVDYSIYADYDLNRRLKKNKLEFVLVDYFDTYAMDYGVSHNLNINQTSKLVLKNFGIFWCVASNVYLICQRIRLMGGRRG